jgi:hypothetical protein
MEGLSTWLSGGGVVILLVTYTIKTFLDTSKDKLRRLNEKDVVDALQEQKIKHHKELNDIKHDHTEFRLEILEKKECECTKENI